jgi:hypothetical protein
MSRVNPRVNVALEVGSKRTFATALDWPGWCRAGRDEDGALDALLAHGPRYAAVLGSSVRGLRPPSSVHSFEVVERILGNASTEFGAPGTPPSGDERPATARDLARLEAILRACWTAFDFAGRSADGVELRTGPRGGGRDLAKIRAHVLESDQAYLGKLGGTAPRGASHEEIRQVTRSLIARAVREPPRLPVELDVELRRVAEGLLGDPALRDRAEPGLAGVDIAKGRDRQGKDRLVGHDGRRLAPGVEGQDDPAVGVA